MRQWKPAFFHPLSFARWTVWRELLHRYGPVGARAWPSRIAISVGILAFSFWHRKELRRLRKSITPDPPVFIVGHWRSGTTHLHNLLHRTGRFATLRTIDALNPLGNNPHGGMFARYLNRMERGFDKVAFGAEEPQEEELALTALGLISIFHLIYFPKHSKEIHKRSILLDGLDAEELEAFAEAYKLVAAKTRLVDGTRRPLLFKNPASTARLDFLSRVFPEARFIHIVRRPLTVFQSSGQLLAGLAEELPLQDPSVFETEDCHILDYKEMMQAHLKQRERLASGHYVEIRYEDLIVDPIAGVEKILGGFGWSLTDNERSNLTEYVNSLAGYQPNRYPDDPETASLLKRELAFVYETWGYD